MDNDFINKVIKTIVHIKAATVYSLCGLLWAFKTGTAFKQEVCIFLALPIISSIYSLSGGKIFFLMGCWLLVLACELLNTAIERVCDLITIEHDELVKVIKDCSSAAVFLTIGANVFLWIWIIITEVE